MKVLLLEDEYSLRESIKEYLCDKGVFVDDFANGEDAFNAIYATSYDILLLDVKVPKKNGFEIAKDIRNDGIATPIIFTTSLTQIDDVEQGYEAGCCDYIKKPFALKELYLRICHVQKTHIYKTPSSSITLPLGYTFDVDTTTLHHKDHDIPLTKKEILMISLLIENCGKVVSIETFQDYVWGEYMDPANIRVQINNLRKKLDDDLIKNVRGLGYKIEKN